MVSQQISEKLTASDHSVTVMEVLQVTPDQLADYELVILGSATVGDGESHESFKRFIQNAEGKEFPDTFFAVFGLGDSLYYSHFCGSVDDLESFVKQLKGKLLIESLRIDQYFFQPAEQTQKITEWTDTLIESIPHN